MSTDSKPATKHAEALSAYEAQQTAVIVRAVEGAALSGAIVEYKRIQDVLDRALPDCIMRIQGRSFRKKNYWRAVATAFNLTVECGAEEYRDINGRLTCLVTYRATAPNGRSAFGDGACDMSEKKGPQATIHNIRAHAHTRAYNRAVSNLVGFGEVSAEEVDRDGIGADEPEVTSMVEVRMATRAAIGRGWTPTEIRAVLEEAAATFTEDNKLAGMPEGNRADVVRILSRDPVRTPSVDDGAEGGSQ